ncbi:MAG: redox-sensing transcriptional repressor Rex [Planctomycetaceae bacterium]|nr:redox-sensing transcriptional repressor Rex [Planctomycetaceae bacterium]
MKYRKIPEETIRRMPRYLRAFSTLQSENQGYISSQLLAERLHLNPPQIRKDLSYFGAFGTRGIGYPVQSTAEQIRSILKLNITQRAALVGAGRLGTAIASYHGFSLFGFDIAAVFDNDRQKIGRRIGGRTIEDVSRIGSVGSRGIQLAILAVPAEAAQTCADQLIKAGIKGILSLSPCYLETPKRIKVISIDLAMELGTLPYYL